MYKILLILTSLFYVESQQNTISSSPSVSPIGTRSCMYRSYNISSDFSGVQGQNGWFYGYNNSGTFTQFSIYENSGTTNNLAWFYDINDWAQIGQSIIIPSMFGSGGGGYCSDITSMAPVLRWVPPTDLCYNDITISLYLSPKSSIGSSLMVNGNVLYLNSNLTTSYTNSFNVYDVSSIQLEIDPNNNDCKDPQITYNIVITPIGSSNTPIRSVTGTPRPSSSTTGSSTCAYRTYNAGSDFSGSQGANGWFYGYYNSGIFTQFTHYQTTSYTSSLAWNYNVNSNGFITSNLIMPNGANTCNTPSYGNIGPVLRWYNPINSCYNDVTIYLSLSPGTTSVVPSLTINGNPIYAPSNGAVYSNYFNAYDVRSVELSVGPLNNNCDSGQTTYSLIISPMGPSNTVLTSKSNTVSNIPSITNIGSRTITNTPRISVTPNLSPSNTLSATATSTVFYYGNWTDFGQYNYAMADIVSYYDMTIYQCQLNCWSNPLCGLIVVESPCTTISLDNPAIYTTACNVCWLKLTSGWIISASSGSKSIMLYDRVYPPTTSSRITYSQTASAIATSSVVTYSSLNFCAISGKTITLPFIGSSTNVMTNAIGVNYGNGLSCNVFINGAGSSQGFQVNITNFNTEGCCDPFRIYNSAGVQVYSNSGVLTPFNLYISGTSYIQLVFSSDGSAVGSGVNAIVSLVYSSISGSPSVSSSLSNSPNPSASPLTSRSITNSPLISSSSLKSNTISSSNSQSKTSTVSIDPTDSLRNSRTNVGSSSATATVFYTGNWTDHGDVYFSGYVGVTGSTTIHQCMIACWLNPLCGGISVNWGCSNVKLDSPQIYTLLCDNCRLIPKGSEMDTYPGAFYQHTEWKSFIIYDKIFPPTSSVISSRTPTISSFATSSVVTYSTINYCANFGRSVTLPFIGSSLLTMTNAIGGQYTNNLGCWVFIYGAGNSQQFRINITSLSTEGCCDFFTVTNSAGTQVARYSGSTGSGTNFIVSGSPFIRLDFTTDGSAVASGVFAIISLEYASMSPSPSVTGSSSTSKSISYSSLPSTSSFKSLSNSHSSLTSKSSSKSPSVSSSNLPSDSPSDSVSESSSISQSSSASNTNNISNSPIITISSSSSYYTTHTNNQTKSSSYSHTNYNSISPTISPKTTISVSYTPTPNYALPFELPPPGKDYNSQVANQLNNYLNDLLSGGQQIPPAQALSVINNIPVLEVSDTMNILKKLSGLVTAPVSFTSSSFEGSLAPIKNTSITVNSSNYGINIPIIPNLPPNSAITAISWSNTTTFSNETTLSNIMSVSISSKGKDTSISNLSTPLILTWNITNIITPPNMTLKCSYWNYTSSSWNSDGCLLLQNTTLVTCSCNHMTDFVTRFERIAEMNKDIFANAGNVYSLDGLQKYKNYYIFYGCYFILMILIGIALQQLDIKNSRQYLKSLGYNLDILKFKKEINKFYIDKCYIYDEHDWDFDEYYEHKNYKNKIMHEIYNEIDPSLKKHPNFINIMNILLDEKLDDKRRKNILDHNSSESESNKKRTLFANILHILHIWWKRLLYQHNYFSIFYKYDPESPRIFRIFFIFTVISHTLFMTALLYGYVHSESGATDNASPIEAIVLSIITSVINVPFMNFIVRVLVLAGKSEFEWRYPFIHREIKKMVIFEEVFYDKNKNKNKKLNINNNENENDEGDLFTNFIVQILCGLCYRKDNSVKILDKDIIFKERINKEIIKIEEIPYEYTWWFSNYLPFHTIRSFLSFFGCLGYLIWTINYLLLFTADAGTDIQIQIMKSFGISQLFSIVLITPMTLFFTLLFSWMYHKYRNTNFNSHSVPLYYHSDPFVNDKSFGLTVRLSKSIFLESIAMSSIHQPTDYKIIAPVKGLIAELLKVDIDSEINKEYYEKIIRYNEINKNLE